MNIDRVSILMSVDNPQGWKLEDVCQKLADELQVKTDKLASSTCPASAVARHNNLAIISRLLECKELQESTMSAFDTHGVD